MTSRTKQFILARRLSAGDVDLRGRSWRQVRLALDALRQQRRRGRAARPTNAQTIGRFLLECDEQSVALQAAPDAEVDLRSRPRTAGPTPSPAPPAESRAVFPCTATGPSADGRNSNEGSESPASATDNELDYDHLETFDAR